MLHLVGILSSRFAHDARSQEHKYLVHVVPRIVTQFTLSSSINITITLGLLELGHRAPSKRRQIFTIQRSITSLSIQYRRKLYEQILVCEIVSRVSPVCPKKSTPPLQRISAYVVAFCTKRNAVFKGLGGGKDNRLSSVSLAPPPPSLTALNPVLQHPVLLCQYQNNFFF